MPGASIFRQIKFLHQREIFRSKMITPLPVPFAISIQDWKSSDVPFRPAVIKQKATLFGVTAPVDAESRAEFNAVQYVDGEKS